ncbi:MAG: GyrI-like domain-containing protein [Candidatus Izemoplasmataceae bacterium]
MEIVKLNTMVIVGYIVTCAYESLFDEVPKLYEKFQQNKDLIKETLNPDVLDITIKVENHLFTQMVGINVPEDIVIPDEFKRVVLEEAYYIKALHEGNPRLIWETFKAMQVYAKTKEIAIDPLDSKIDLYHQENNTHTLYQKIIKSN